MYKFPLTSCDAPTSPPARRQNETGPFAVAAAAVWSALRLTLGLQNNDALAIEISLMYFEIKGTIEDIEPIAIGSSIRDLSRLKKQFGPGRWHKLKGTANVQLDNGHVRRAEVHWYEAHGIGRRKMKIKRFLD